MLGGVIERRPWTVIVAWIIIVALLAKYAAAVNNVVKTETESFLPQDVESVRAEKSLKSLENSSKTSSSTRSANYLLIVKGVPVSLETYYKLKDNYVEAKKQVPGSMFSWIDILLQVETNTTSAMTAAVNGTVTALEGLMGLSEGYSYMLSNARNLSMLISGTDLAYSQLMNTSELLASQSESLLQAAIAINSSCNNLLPLIAYTYMDVVRVEVILETRTNAYQNLSLTPQDVQLVVALTNLSEEGIKPVSPQFVYAVFNLTLLHGGPVKFNNTVAAEIAGIIAWNGLKAELPPEELSATGPLFNATLGAWRSLMANQSDSREIVVLAPNLKAGQLLLAKTITDLIDYVKPDIAETALQVLLSQSPPEAAPLLSAIEQAAVNANCTTEPSTWVAQAYMQVLSQNLSGIPGLEELAQSLATGVVPKDLILNISIALVLQQAGSQLGNESSMIAGALAELIETYDPDGRELLVSGPLLNATTAYLVATMGGTQLSPALVGELAQENATLEYAVFRVFSETVNTTRGPEAAALAAQLWNSHLLGAPKEWILSNATRILAPGIMERGNLSEQQAAAIVEAAVRVYTNQSTLDEEVSLLVKSIIESVFDKVVEEMKGLLISKDLNGFIISYLPSKEADGSQELDNAKKILENALQSAGFTGFRIIKGGQAYMAHEMREASLEDIKKSDRMSMIFVLIMMAIILESIAAVFLPFIGIGFGLVTSLAIAYFLAKGGVIDITTHSRTIMYTTGLGLGIDYAVYVSRRFREAAAHGLPTRRAAREAFEKSWRPVLAGATTAMIGFGSMMIATDFPFIYSIGTNVPLTIFMVMIASITFIPALLAYVGETRWFWWPRQPTGRTGEGRLGSTLSRVSGRPVLALTIVVLVSAASIWVVTSYPGSYDISLNLPRGTESLEAVNTINSDYDPGVLYPTYIVASSPDSAKRIADEVGSLDCVARTSISEDQPRVVYAYMSVNPLSYDGVKCVQTIREKAHAIDSDSLVGGMSAINLDLRDRINTIFYHEVYPVAITLMFLTMLAAYGGVLSAIAAVFSVVLAAYIGSAMAIALYHYVLGMEVLWYLPVITFTAILGVGMDYNSFYLARAREECEKTCSPEGVRRSIALGSPTVIGLSLIMSAAYLGLAVSSIPGLAQMGTALLLGVATAGLLASLFLTPPIIILAKSKAWWPRRVRADESR